MRLSSMIGTGTNRYVLNVLRIHYCSVQFIMNTYNNNHSNMPLTSLAMPRKKSARTRFILFFVFIIQLDSCECILPYQCDTHKNEFNCFACHFLNITSRKMTCKVCLCACTMVCFCTLKDTDRDRVEWTASMVRRIFFGPFCVRSD